MIRPVFAICALLFFASLPSSAENPEPASARGHYALEDGLAIEGYDPVAYFRQGKATPGKAAIATEFEGVTYRFSSKENLEAFEAEPDRYRPAYGGWCAWAMVDGGKTAPDPENFIVSDGRLFLFFKNFFVDTKTKWEDGDPVALERKADTAWRALIGA